MDQLSRVPVSGPLATYAAGFRERLTRQGYSQWTAIAHLYLMDHVSVWLESRRMTAEELTDVAVLEYLEYRRASGHVRRLTPRGLIPLLGYLRELGVAPEIAAAVPEDRAGQLVVEFTAFLVDQRGLAAGTVWYYGLVARRFLGSRSVTDPLGGMAAADVGEFVLTQCGLRSVGSLKNTVTALRALLRFLYVRGHIPLLLVDAVPAAAGWSDHGRAETLRPADIALLLSSCDRNSAAGRRDYAILLLLSRLGLRAVEVAALTVEDIDWRAGEIRIRGKGNHLDKLPLPTDVGRALADYCRNGRPVVEHRRLFTLVRAPYSPVSSTVVGNMVKRACRRAGVTRVSSHQLRHGTATALRRAGSPPAEIRQILRHGHPATTARYGTIEALELTPVCRVWPGGAR